MKAPINLFFDITPTGLIISRFNGDMNEFGDAIHYMIWGLYNFMHLLMTLYTVGNANPIVLLGVPVLMAYTYWIMKFTKGSYNELHRVLKVSETPISSHYSETMSGNSTIRSFGTRKYAIDRNIEINDERNLALNMSVAGLIWYSLQMRMSASVLMFAAGILCTLSRGSKDPYVLAMAFSYIMDLGDLYCSVIH